MRILLYAVGSIVALIGAIWTLQGFNLLPGSFMTGQLQWAVYGLLTLAAGIAIVYFAKRLRRSGAR